MWALRRASASYVRAHGLNLASFRACAAGHVQFGSNEGDNLNHPEQLTCMDDGWFSSKRCYCSVRLPNRSLAGSRTFSVQTGARSGSDKDDDLEDGFSELETPEVTETTQKALGDDDSTSISESELSDDENVEDTLETELIEATEEEVVKSTTNKKREISDLCMFIINDTGSSVSVTLDKYVADGKELNRAEIYNTLLYLRKRKLFGKALQLSEWLEAKKLFEFGERDYASRLDLIAKFHGLQRAEHYIEDIPNSYRKEVVYRTLLANCVSITNVKKAEEVFNKMKDLGFPLTAFACNQLLLLYKRIDKKKISDVLLSMEKENIKPTLFTYICLIDAKGHSNDIAGMDQIVETMKADGIEPNFRVLALLARYYAAAGFHDRATAILKKMEGVESKVNRWVLPNLLRTYSEMSNADEVEKAWKACESNTRNHEYVAAVEAFGKLGNVEKAEAIFQKMSKSTMKLTTVHYTIMLKVYAENKMFNKGKELLNQIGDSGCHIGPAIWDILVKLYVDAGEVEKADSILLKARQKSSLKPFFNSYMRLLDAYAKKGDIHNAEKTFHRMRQVGYVSRVRPFQVLLQAYITAKVPAYGFRERLKADEISLNKTLAAQLSLVDAFKKTAVSELLD